MKCFPIIPIPIMSVICIVLIIILAKNIKKNVIQVLIVFLLFFINLRVMLPTNKSTTVSNNLDVLFVIDTTISMNALDYNGDNTRLSGVKDDCKYIIEKLSGSRFSVLTFDNSTKLLMPFTTDNNMAVNAIEPLSPVTELYAKGTTLNKPLDDMEDILKSAVKKDDSRNIVVFFISDGEITDDSSLKSFASLKKYIADGAVLGYGTTSGGYMKEYDKYTEKEKYIEYDFKKAVSKIDEKNLKKLASDMGISYIHMDKQSRIDSKLEKLKNETANKVSKTDKSSFKDTYFILMIPLLVLLMLMFKKYKRRIS